jgi:hypothetical protein
LFFLAEQWVCNTDSRVNLPSCQLADLGSISHPAVDDIKECMFLDGIQGEIGVQDDITSTTCVLSAARRRFGMEAPKGTGRDRKDPLIKITVPWRNLKPATSFLVT